MLKSIGTCAGTFMLIVSGAANAALLDFRFMGTGPGGAADVRFSLDSLQAPSFVIDGSVAVYNFNGGGLFTPQGETGGVVAFYDSARNGGLDIGDQVSFYFDAEGDQVFSGTAEAPTFRTGTWRFFDSFYGGPTSVDYTLTIADPAAAAAPEPATWGLMAVGFGLAGASMRRRRTAVSYA